MILRGGSKLSAVAATIGLAFALPAAAQAAGDTFNVTTTQDAPLSAKAAPDTCVSILPGGPCTLRAALQAATLTDQSSTVNVPAGTYGLTVAQSAVTPAFDGSAGHLEIGLGAKGSAKTVTVTGAGATSTVVKADWILGNLNAVTADRILEIDGDASHALTVDLSGLEITGGTATPFFLPCSSDGAGILVTGGADVSIARSAIVGNAAGPGTPFGNGGGIALSDECTRAATTGDLTVSDTTIADNTAGGFGGGVYTRSSGVHTFVDDTLNNNHSGANGGGYYATGDPAGSASFVNDTLTANSAGKLGGGIDLDAFNPASMASASILNSTIDANVVRDDGGLPGNGGNVAENNGNVTIENSIVTDGFAGDVYSSGDPSALNNCFDQPAQPGSTVSLGHNVFDNNDCNPVASDHQVVPGHVGLDVLALNAPGLTETQGLLAGSVAIGGGDAAACPKTDERGVTRKSPCDVGAYELVPQVTTTTTTSSSSSSSSSSAAPATAIQTVLTVTQTVTTPAPPSGGVKGAQTIVPPKSVVCSSRRHFRIRIQNARKLHIVRADVFIDGRRVEVLHPRHGRFVAQIDLRGLPRGSFELDILARLRDGRLIRGKRVYHTCRGHHAHRHASLRL